MNHLPTDALASFVVNGSLLYPFCILSRRVSSSWKWEQTCLWSVAAIIGVTGESCVQEAQEGIGGVVRACSSPRPHSHDPRTTLVSQCQARCRGQRRGWHRKRRRGSASGSMTQSSLKSLCCLGIFMMNKVIEHQACHLVVSFSIHSGAWRNPGERTVQCVRPACTYVPRHPLCACASGTSHHRRRASVS